MVGKIKEKKRKILVTGFSGMFGSALCPLLSKAYEVTGLDVNCTDEALSCDIRDYDKVRAVISDVKPDIVIHAAAWTDVDGCEKDPKKADEINIKGTRNIKDVLSDLDITMIYLSTDFVFDGAKGAPYVEKDMPNPQSIYARSKLEGESITAELNKHIIIRTGWLYGSGGKNFVDAILDKARREKEIKVVDDQIGSPTYTKDLADAIKKLLDLTVYEIRDAAYEIRETYHVSNKGEVSWFNYAKEILNIAGIKDVKVAPINSKQLNRPAKRPAYSVLDNTKFEKKLNFKMRAWQNALKEYLDEKYA